MGKNWLNTRATWHFVQFDDETTGRAALFNHRSERLPWARDIKRLLFTISDDTHELSIYRIDHIPVVPIPISSAMYRMSSCDVTKIQEFVEWPGAEAIYSGFTRFDLSESIPSDWLADAISNKWRTESVPGWWLINRGVLGISFLREAVDIRNGDTISIEATALSVSLYRGSIAENEALDERRIFKIFSIDDLEIERLTKILSVDSAILLRNFIRRHKYFIYTYATAINLPF